MAMNTAEKIRILMGRKNISMGEMAEKTGQSRQNFSNKMKRANFSESEIMQMAAVLGCTVDIQFIDKNGEIAI